MFKRPTTSVPATYQVQANGLRNFTTRNARNAARIAVVRKREGRDPQLSKNGNPVNAPIGTDGPAMASLSGVLEAA